MAARLARRSRLSPVAQRRAAGFTLMEIMVVVIIVGIMAGIALPSYQEAMRKGRRADAKQALMSAANREEQFMLDRSTYTDDMEELGFEDDPMISEEEHYEVDRIDCDAISAGNVSGTPPSCPSICNIDSDADTPDTCYVLRAKPRSSSPQIDDKRCTSFSLDSAGKQTATGKDAENCW